jgi:hypothetical protein
MAGYRIISITDAIRFADRFLTSRPDPDHLRKIRQCIGPVRLSTREGNYAEKLAKRILSACMDIASSSVTEYPYKFQDRFSREEKLLFMDILETFHEYAPNFKATETD